MCCTVVRSPESHMDSMREEDGGIFMEKEMDKMSYMYKTRGTCSTQIEVELDEICEVYRGLPWKSAGNSQTGGGYDH